MAYSIEFPEELYRKIAAYAAKQGKTPEELLIALAEQAIFEEDVDSPDEGIIPDDHPFFQLSGIISSDDPGWPERHDELIAQAISDEYDVQAHSATETRVIIQDEDQETPDYVYDPTTDPLAPFIGAFDLGDEPITDREIDFYHGGGTYEEWQARKKEQRHEHDSDPR